MDIERYGIAHARCVDARAVKRIGRYRLSRLKTRYEELAKDKAQRKECRSIEHRRRVAKHPLKRLQVLLRDPNPAFVARNMNMCDPKSSLL